MKTGPQPFLRKRLNPKLREALLAEMRDGRPSWLLAVVGRWPQQTIFSNQLHAEQVRLTPLTIERFARVAAAVGFDGPLFLDDEPEVRR